jgi:hypothetical protein
MKRRGWRVALTVATLGLALAAGLVALNWATVRDHAEAWWFLMMREPEGEISPPALRETPVVHVKEVHLSLLALSSGCPVVFDRDALPAWTGLMPDPQYRGSTAAILQHLRDYGYRIVEQRFPRRAYVVVGYPPEPSFVPSGKMPSHGLR